jgi:hypothetical protein
MLADRRLLLLSASENFETWDNQQPISRTDRLDPALSAMQGTAAERRGLDQLFAQAEDNFDWTVDDE